MLPGKNAVLQLPLENFQRRQNMCDRHALCQVLKHGDKWSSDCESSSACYYSQIEGLGLHVVSITHYVIRIKKHLHNWNGKAIIEIELKRAVKFNIPFNCEACAVPAGKWFVVMYKD